MGTQAKPWIVSPVYDLGFFVLPCLLSLAIFAFYEVLVHLDVPNLTLWVFGIYVVFDSFFDTPHIFQSFSRTHKDMSQYRKYRLAFTWGFLALIIFDTYIFYLGYKEIWMVFFACIGYYHIGKQNIGFLMAYRAKSGQFFKAVDKRVRLKWLGYSFIYGIVMGWILYSGQSGIWAIAIEPTFLSIILFHYLSDGFIWRFSKDPQLRTLLH